MGFMVIFCGKLTLERPMLLGSYVALGGSYGIL